MFNFKKTQLQGYLMVYNFLSKPLLLTLDQFDACICLISTDLYSKFPKINLMGRRTNFYFPAGGERYCVRLNILMNLKSNF